MSEKCPACKDGTLVYEWMNGKLRLICHSMKCRAIFRPDYTRVDVCDYAPLPTKQEPRD